MFSKVSLALLSIGAAASAEAPFGGLPLEALDVQQTQDLLVEWGLDSAFGEEFSKLKINGALLNLYRPGDLDTDAFPRAHKLHWKLLNEKLKQISEAGDPAMVSGRAGGRRSLSSDSEYTGISIRRNKSHVSFGELGDAMIRRSGDSALEIVGKLLVSTGDNEIADVGEVLTYLGLAIKGYPPANICLPSCKHFKQSYPNAESGVYCIDVEDNQLDLWCEMDTMGGGWTYVARGTYADNGCTQNSFGTVTNDPGTNTRWSIGQSRINQIGAYGFNYLEYYVTIGHNNDNGYDSHDRFRAYRVAAGTGMSMSEPMDNTYGVQVWAGGYWITGEYECNPGDCGPCWEPGRQNLCCNATFGDCSLASMNQEGQWSHSNTNQHLRCDVKDYDQDQLVLYVRGSNVIGQQCYSSCLQAKQHNPNARSGVYCIIVGGVAERELYCDMVTQGGGWTYVARGTNANDGCDTDAFGTISADPQHNTRWSLGDYAINEIGYDQGSDWLEYIVALGPNNDAGIQAHKWTRYFRVERGDNFTLGSEMDVDYNVQVWGGSSWTDATFSCNVDDCGPCWEPDYQNWCCEIEQSSGLMLNCVEAGKDQEGQWSHLNTNQHLRCFNADSDQDSLVLFVR